MVNNIEAKKYIDEKYPINGVCKRDKDLENKGKKRDEIIKLDLSKGNLGGKHFYSSGDGGKILVGSLKLEGFTNLKILIISSHQLTSLDVNNCPILEELDCQNNQIDNLKFAGCSNLKKLTVCNNKLEEIDVNYCPSLNIEAVKSDLDYDDKRKKFVKNLVSENAQEWLDENYPLEGRKEHKTLKIQEKNLEGELDLTDFINLEELYCYCNKLTEIKFADGSVDKLRGLFIGNNNFPKQNLSFFSKFKSLRVLNLGNNNFFGSLKALENLLNLESLDISDTDIDDGLENLRGSKLEGIYCQVKERENAKCQKIQEELKKYCTGNDCYDFKSWAEETKEKKQVSNDDKHKRKGKICREEPKRKPEIPVKNVLLIGKTGSGKSNLANVLTKSEEFKSGAGSTSVTKNVEVKKISHNGINYRIIDTVGLGDTELTSEELLNSFALEVDSFIGEGINRIFLVVGGRITEDVLTDYRFLSSFLFDKKVFRYTTIVRTSFTEFKNEQECENDRKEIKKIKSIKNIGSDKEQINIVYVDSPTLKYGEAAERKREESRNILLKHLEDISDINYEPMNGEKLKERFEPLDADLQKWMSELDENDKKLLGKVVEGNEDKWIETSDNISVYEVSENENYPEFKEFKNEVVLKQKKLSEQKAKQLLKRLKELVKLNKDIEDGNWVNRTIEEEKKYLEELIKDCKKSLSEGKKRNKDLLERKVDELLDWQRLFIMEEQYKVRKTKSLWKRQSNYQVYQDELKKAKKELKKRLDDREVENLAKQKEKVIRLEMLAKTLKKTKRYQIQEKILEYLQKEWSAIHRDFGNTETRKLWAEESDLTRDEVKGWFKIYNNNLEPQEENDRQFVMWLKREKNLSPQDVSGTMADELLQDYSSQTAQVLVNRN